MRALRATQKRQPAGAARIDRTLPLARGLIDTFTATESLLGAGGIVKRPTALGLGAAAATATSGGFLLPTAPRTTNAGTVIFICPQLTNAAGAYLWDGESSTNRDLFYQLGPMAGANAAAFGWYVNLTLIADNGNQPIPSGFLDGRVCALRWVNGAQAAFRDGVLFQTWTRALSAGPARRLRLCSRFGSTEGLTTSAIVLRHEWNYAMTDDEIVRASAQIWSLYDTPRRLGWAFIVDGVTIYRPNGDVVTSWTPTGAATVAGAIGEVTASDAEYAESPDLSTPQVCTLNATAPAGTYNVRVRARRSATQGQIRVRLLDSSSVDVGGSAWQALTATETTYTLSATTTAAADRIRIEVQA